jgi:hypothetical protein
MPVSHQTIQLFADECETAPRPQDAGKIVAIHVLADPDRLDRLTLTLG